MQKLLFLLFLSSNVFGQALNFSAKALIMFNDEANSPVKVDQLISLPFPLAFNQIGKRFEVSNSIENNTKSTCYVKSKGLLYILETKGANNAIGQYVSVLDVSNPLQIIPKFKFKVSYNPKAISLSPNEEYLAVCSNQNGSEVEVYELDQDGKPLRVIKGPGYLRGESIVDIDWSPDGKFLAYINGKKNELGLLKMVLDAPTQKITGIDHYSVDLQFYGNPIVGRFSNNSNFYVLDDKNGVSQGEIFFIKFNFSTQTQPIILSKCTVGLNPLNFIFTPEFDGILVSNSNNFTLKNKNNIEDGSVSYCNISDPSTINFMKEIPVGVGMPFGIVFDETGTKIALTCFSFKNYGIGTGGLVIYDLAKKNGNIELSSPQKIVLSQGIYGLVRI